MEGGAEDWLLRGNFLYRKHRRHRETATVVVVFTIVVVLLEMFQRT